MRRRAAHASGRAAPAARLECLHRMTIEELSSAGFAVSAAAHARLCRFVDALLDENRRTNLTALRDPALAWPLHVCDGLAFLPLLDALAPARVVDVGTGGGVPGLPLACCRDAVRFTLVDATRKKVDAARRIATALGLLNVDCVWGRAEALGASPAHRGVYDALTARAVAALPELIGCAAALVRPGGRCLFAKSLAAVPKETDAAADAARRHGLALADVHRYRLPDPHGERLILAYEKASASPDPAQECGRIAGGTPALPTMDAGGKPRPAEPRP